MEKLKHSFFSDNLAAGLAYITVIPAIIFLTISPFSRNPKIRFHSWQSIFLCIAWFVVDFVLSILGHSIPYASSLIYGLIPLAGLGFFILWVILLINAFNGKHFSVPVIGKLAEKQAGK